MKAKLQKILQWVKEKWYVAVSIGLGLSALFLVRSREKVISSSRKNADLDAKVYDITEQTNIKIRDKTREIDSETRAKLIELKNKKKDVTAKFQEEKKARLEELKQKSPKELADLLKRDKD